MKGSTCASHMRSVVPSETELSQWPARGEVYVCRRSTLGGYAWQPLFPAYPALDEGANAGMRSVSIKAWSR